MLPKTVSVGPPLQDLASWNSSKLGRNEESKESFEATLTGSMSGKEPKSTVPKPQAKTESVEPKKVPRQDDKVSSEKEVPEEPIKAKKETPLEKKASLAKQKVIEKFMDSFESEFGIAPTRLVEAMATLPAEELTKNPEQTVDSVIAQLDLSEEQEGHAKQMYMTLVSDLSQIDKTATTPKLMPTPVVPMSGPMSGPMAQAMTKERFMAAQEKKTNLNKSLDQMNDRFWNKSAASVVATHMVDDMAPMKVTQADPWLQQEMAANQELRQTQMFDDGMMSPPAPEKGVVIPAGFEPTQNEELQTEDPALGLAPIPLRPRQAQSALMTKMRQAMQAEQNSMLKPREKIPFSPPSAMTKAMAAQAALKEALQEMPEQNMAQPMMMQAAALGRPEDVEMEVDSWEPVQSDLSQMSLIRPEGYEATELPMDEAVVAMPEYQPMQETTNKLETMVQNKSEGKTANKGVFKKTLDSLDSMSHPSLQKAEISPKSAPLEAAPGFMVRGPSEQDTNIRQIMNQAQYLIKKGGGEMKVEMSPEGLGTLQMKVVVNEGRVNLQMAADTKEAKQVLESSLADLKNNLSAHKLSVDQVKIDVVSSTNTDNSSQNSQNNQQQPRDGGTRQFWQQFQENFGNRSRQDGYFDLPALKGYTQKKRDPLAPLDASDARPSRKVEGKGSGIDLVA